MNENIGIDKNIKPTLMTHQKILMKIGLSFNSNYLCMEVKFDCILSIFILI